MRGWYSCPASRKENKVKEENRRKTKRREEDRREKKWREREEEKPKETNPLKGLQPSETGKKLK